VSGGPAVTVVGIGIAGLGGGQIEADHVPRIPGEERTALVGEDDVIGRREHGRHVADRLGRVAEGAKRSDDGHVGPRQTVGLGRRSGNLDGSFREIPEPNAGTGIVR
jgi:hypothetical protein